MTRSVPLAAVVLATILLASCSASASTPAAPASTASVAAASVPAGCASALKALPESAPDTIQQATGDYDALSAGIAETTAVSLANDVGADSMKIEFDLLEHLSVTADVAQWQADAKALRFYCS